MTCRLGTKEEKKLVFCVIAREIGEGWPLLTAETEQMGTQGVQMTGILPFGWVVGLIVPVQDIFLCNGWEHYVPYRCL
jgi:hypothetical protein